MTYRELTPEYEESYWNYKMRRWEAINSQVLYLVYIGNYTYQDVMSMAPYDRRRAYEFIDTVRQKEKEEIEKG